MQAYLASTIAAGRNIHQVPQCVGHQTHAHSIARITQRTHEFCGRALLPTFHEEVHRDVAPQGLSAWEGNNTQRWAFAL